MTVIYDQPGPRKVTSGALTSVACLLKTAADGCSPTLATLTKGGRRAASNSVHALCAARTTVYICRMRTRSPPPALCCRAETRARVLRHGRVPAHPRQPRCQTARALPRTFAQVMRRCARSTVERRQHHRTMHALSPTALVSPQSTMKAVPAANEPVMDASAAQAHSRSSSGGHM